MTLAQEDITFIKSHLREWLAEQGLRLDVAYELELRERLVRVEEALQHQRELMYEGFKAMDKRFEALQLEMDRRFGALREDSNRRFESIDRRYELIQADIKVIQTDIKSINTEIKNLYRALNLQTWKLFGGIGLLAALLKVMEMI